MEIKDGYYDGMILSADIIKHRYAKDDGDNRLEVELTCGVYDANHQPIKGTNATVYLELSAEYPKFGDTTKPFWQATMEQLKELGLQGDDLTTLSEQLKNKPCRLCYRSVDKNGCTLKNPGWYLTRARERVVIKATDANAILKQMMGGGNSAGVGIFSPPVTLPTGTMAEPNPFN